MDSYIEIIENGFNVNVTKTPPASDSNTNDLNQS